VVEPNETNTSQHILQAHSLSTEQLKIEALKGLVKKLPERNAAVLRFLFRSLQKIEVRNNLSMSVHLMRFLSDDWQPQARSSVNMMTATNLSIVFAPNLIKAKEETYHQGDYRRRLTTL